MIEVDVKVRASRTRVVGVVDGRLQAALSAPPVEGAANRALVQLLAKTFSVRKSQVVLVGGERHRRKRLEVKAVSLAEIQAQLPAQIEEVRR